MKMKMKRLIAIILPLLCLIGFVACKASLDKSGVYAQPGGGGMFLFTVDKTLVDSKETLNAFVSWEFAHHAQVASTWPAISQAADNIRANAPSWFADALELRGVYVTASTLVNSNALNARVQLIQTAAITSGPLTNNIK